MSQSPRIGAIIRIGLAARKSATADLSLNPLESGQSFESKTAMLFSGIISLSQSPRIGAIIRIAGSKEEVFGVEASLNPLESGQSFEWLKFQVDKIEH